jgi:hypothetical protein
LKLGLRISGHIAIPLGNYIQFLRELVVALRERAVAGHVGKHDRCEFALFRFRAHESVNIAPLLVVNQQLRITDDVDEQDVPNLKLHVRGRRWQH